MSDLPSPIVVTAFGATDVGRARSRNEDAFLISALATEAPVTEAPNEFDASNHAVLLAVADGVGGQNAGDVASKLTLEALRKALPAECDRRSIADALRISIEATHDEV